MEKRRIVLIVEDDAPLRDLLSVRLQAHHYDVFTAKNGQQALEICRQHKPHLMLLDVNLPDILGIDVVENIQSAPLEFGTPKVIVLTGIAYSVDDPKERWSNEYGVADFIAKPFDYEVLLQKIETALKA